MKMFFSKMASSSLDKKDLEIFQSLDQENYGRELARKAKGEFTLGEVNDGMGPHPVLITFESLEEFVEWLANQNDQSMSLYTVSSFNNQTISKIRLKYYLDNNYNPGWNSYCEYLRERR